MLQIFQVILYRIQITRIHKMSINYIIINVSKKRKEPLKIQNFYSRFQYWFCK